MGFRIRWPSPRRRRRLELLDVDAKVAQAAADRRSAERERHAARELANWAREATASNRLDLRLEAAWRLQTRRQGG
jgi:hypothetical protein